MEYSSIFVQVVWNSWISIENTYIVKGDRNRNHTYAPEEFGGSLFEAAPSRLLLAAVFGDPGLLLRSTFITNINQTPNSRTQNYIRPHLFSSTCSSTSQVDNVYTSNCMQTSLIGNELISLHNYRTIIRIIWLQSSPPLRAWRSSSFAKFAATRAESADLGKYNSNFINALLFALFAYYNSTVLKITNHSSRPAPPMMTDRWWWENACGCCCSCAHHYTLAAAARFRLNTTQRE